MLSMYHSGLDLHSRPSVRSRHHDRHRDRRDEARSRRISGMRYSREREHLTNKLRCLLCSQRLLHNCKYLYCSPGKNRTTNTRPILHHAFATRYVVPTNAAAMASGNIVKEEVELPTAYWEPGSNVLSAHVLDCLFLFF